MPVHSRHMHMSVWGFENPAAKAWQDAKEFDLIISWASMPLIVVLDGRNKNI